jgi:serine/threonine-protein kinase
VTRSLGFVSDILARLQSTLADRYVFERELGRGGMATVFLAGDVKHDRAVAIKVLHPELSASIGGERFEREIRLAAKLQHPHILGLHDSGQVDGLLYYVMPFVQGESLRDRLDREGQLPIDDAIQIVLEVADALGYAHAQGIVHRDVKPENVLLASGHALVADFGIATAASEGTGPKLTSTGVAVGTPVYMAPEQAAGDAVGPTADLYSLGCMLYEMLAGEPPFTGKSGQAIMARHAMENVPSIRIVRNTVPAEVEDAIFASMAKVPADRPQTAAQLSEILGLPAGATASRRAALRHTASRRVPTLATPVSATVAVPLWRRPAVAVPAALAVVAAGFGAWRILAGGRAPAATPDGPDPKQIAVLYFEDLSPSRTLGFLADGLTESLIATLSGVPQLRVISRAGVEPFRGTTLAPDSVARTLQAGTIVRGSVEPAGDRIRVAVRLIDGRSGVDLDRGSFEKPAANAVAVRDSLTFEAERMIRVKLGDEIRLRERRETTRSAEAWSFFQQAERIRKTGDAAAKQGDTAAMAREFRRADSLFLMAQDLDRRWADPIIARSLVAYLTARQVRRDPVALRAWTDRGVALADSALALSPKHPDALELRGNLRYLGWLQGLEGDQARADQVLATARSDLEEATRVNPTQAGAWASLSHLYYQASATTVDIKIAAQRAYEYDAYLSNADVILARLFLASYDLEQFTDADRSCEELRRRFPATYQAPRCALFLLTTRIKDPDLARAWRLADTMAALAPADAREFWANQAHLLAAVVVARTWAADSVARAPLADSARHVVSRSIGNAEIDPSRDLTQYGAFALALLGDRAGAVDLLKLYVAANERRRAALLENVSWWYRPLVDDPRFKQLAGAAR